ncbi:MAG: hypothetical protein MUC68_13080 [Burkholderiaceae bacterium]|nr:hypothetical protein [Burkholderiaceae bacterium]
MTTPVGPFPPRAWLLSAAALATLTACGSGGSGSGGAVLPPPPPPGGSVNWGPVTALATAAPSVTAPAAAIDGAGVAAVLWSQTGLTPVAGRPPLAATYVAARENTAIGGWAATQLVESASMGDGATDRIIDLQARGPAVGSSAAWLRTPVAGSNDRVRVVRREAANAWGFGNVVSGPPGVARSELAFASNDAGVQAVAWVEPVAGVPQVQLRTRRIGVADWSAPSVPVQTDPGIAGGQPAVTVDANGIVMVAWRRGGANGELRARGYDALSGTSFNELVVSTNQLDQRNPRVVAVGPNQFVVAWEQLSGSIYDLRATRGTTASWIANPPAVDARAESVAHARLMASPNAGALVLWQQADTLFASRLSAASGSWSQPVQIGAGLAGVARDLRAGIDANGNAIAVWTQTGSSGVPDLYYATVTGTVPVGSTPVLLETEAGSADAPAIGVNAAGNAVVAWLQTVAGQAQRNVVARVAR